MSGKMQNVFLIQANSMKDSIFLHTAYTDAFVADNACIERSEDWVDYKAVMCEAELIEGGRCLANGSVYSLSTKTKEQLLIQNALAKLSEFEIELLGLKSKKDDLINIVKEGACITSKKI